MAKDVVATTADDEARKKFIKMLFGADEVIIGIKKQLGLACAKAFADGLWYERQAGFTTPEAEACLERALDLEAKKLAQAGA